MNLYLRLMWVFLITAAACALMDYRLQRAGDWLPPVPKTIGTWTSYENPIPEDQLAVLGHPKTISRIYTDPIGDHVSVTVMAASSMDTYHDPRSCALGSGFDLTAEKLLPLAGPGTNVRGLVFRSANLRYIMYYWLQNSDGSLNTEGAIRHDVFARLSSIRTIFNTVATGRRTCVVRIFAVVPDDDTVGYRTRRHIATLSQHIYEALRGRS